MMSSSDAAARELRAETSEHGAAREQTAAARLQQHESDESATRRQSYTSTHSHDAAHTGVQSTYVSVGPETSHHRGNEVQTQQVFRFSSCLSLRLCSRKDERANQRPDLSLCRLTQSAETCCQINGQSSDPSVKFFSDSSSPERSRFTSTKDKNHLTAVSSRPKSLSGGASGPRGHKDSSRASPESQSEIQSVQLHDTKQQRDKGTYPGETSGPLRSMLSSSVVMVLAPHWSSRLRRTKRFEGINNPDPHGSLQDVTNTGASRTQERFQQPADWPSTDRYQERVRVPFLAARSSTEGWSTKSGPASLGFRSKRTMIGTVSLDSNYEKMDNRKMDAGALSPLVTNPSSVSPLSPEPHNQIRNPQNLNQDGLSSLSSKPTTSNLLLTLRRFNSNSRLSNTASPISDIDTSDPKGKSFPTLLSQTFHNNNDQDRSKPLLSPSFNPCKKTEMGPLLSQPPSNHRERAMFETGIVSAPPPKKDANATFTQKPQTLTRAQSSLLSSKQASLDTMREQNFRGSNSNLFSESSSPRHSFDRSMCLPRRTTLTSTSWWKKVSQDGSSLVKRTNSVSVKDKPNTPFTPPSRNNGDLATASPTDNKRFNSQIASDRENKNTAAVFSEGNITTLMKLEGGSPNRKQSASEDSPEHEPVRQHNESKPNNRQPHVQSLPDSFVASKISRALAQTTLSHPKDLSKCDVSDGSHIAKTTAVPPTLLNTKSSNTPTESSSKHKKNQSEFETSQQNEESKGPKKPFISLSNTNTLGTEVVVSKQSPSLKLANTKTNPAFQYHQVSPQNINSPSSANCPPQISRFTLKGNTTPLGFKRSFDSLPKPFHHKAASRLSPTINTVPETENRPTHPASFTPTNTISSLLTPPSTPVITSPKSDSSCPQEESTFSRRQERDREKALLEGKSVRHVTWGESTEMKPSEPITAKEQEPSLVQTSPLPSSRSSPRVKAPSIMSFPRSSSPTKSLYPFCTTEPQSSGIQEVKGGKHRSFSPDSADSTSRELSLGDPVISNQDDRDVTRPRLERTQSGDSGSVQRHFSTPLSLPPEFFSGYKLRYSSPPYSTLVSTRSPQGETKVKTSRSQLFQKTSNNVPPSSESTDPAEERTICMSKPPLSPTGLSQVHKQSVTNKTPPQGSSKFENAETYGVNIHYGKNNSQTVQKSQILLVNNRVDVGSNSLQDDQVSSQTFVTETLVYSLKSNTHSTKEKSCPLKKDPANTTKNVSISALARTRAGLQLNMDQSPEVADKPESLSAQSSSCSSSDSQPTDSCRRNKDSLLSKSRLFSVDASNEQCPKRSLFALKKNASASNSSLCRSESDRTNKTNNKMDQVLSRLKQTFSTKRSDDEAPFLWRRRRASQTHLGGGSRDINNDNDVPAEGKVRQEETEQEKYLDPRDTEKVTEETKRWTQDKYSIRPTQTSGGKMEAEKVFIWSDKQTPDKNQDVQNASTELLSKNKMKPDITIESLTMPQFDFNKESRTDHNPRETSPESVLYPPQFRKSTASPRSPFSPFSSLSPVSPFPSPDVTDDSVFYSPKLQRRREPEEGNSMRASRKSRASTGPPSVSPGHDKTGQSSSYANLKYGIEPGRSFSVTSVLSSRPSGPGRISTGSRFMSVGDLSEPSLSCGGMGMDLDQRTVSPDWTRDSDVLGKKDCLKWYFPSDPGKMRTRSLPRSLTRCLANWSSEVSDSVTTTASKPARLWSPNMNTCHFKWDIDGPPTPPPTPPLSPVSRRMSKPPSMSSPTLPSSPGAKQTDGSSPKGHLPSRSYISSLSTFEESSDSSSDTTTDDEYYLEDEKETEL